MTNRCIPRHAVRWIALLLPLLFAACSEGPPPAPASFPSLTYGYLTKLELNVGSVNVENRFVPRSAADVEGQSPVTPVQALEQMARDRLVPAGSAGRAVFVIDDASIIQNGDTYNGSMAVHLDIIGPNGGRTGYAEARVARTYSTGGANENRSVVLYNLTKQMMDAMNVEFEYQVRRTLRDWLVPTAASQPFGQPNTVEQQQLGAPGAPAPSAPPQPMPSLAPPASAPSYPPPSASTPSYQASPSYGAPRPLMPPAATPPQPGYAPPPSGIAPPDQSGTLPPPTPYPSNGY